jgi:hypothetical protein
VVNGTNVRGTTFVPVRDVVDSAGPALTNHGERGLAEVLETYGL